MTAQHHAARKLPRLFIALAAVVVIVGYAAYLINRPMPVARGTLAQQISLGASATSGFYMTGTLATLGSFDWDVAPVQTHVAIAARATADKLLKHAITVSQAIAIQAELKQAKHLLSEAITTCDQNARTGKCRGDELRARGYLDHAKRVLASVPY